MDALNADMDDYSNLIPETAEIFRRLDAAGLKQRELAQAIGIEENKISKVKSGERQLKAPEMVKAMNWLASVDESRRHTLPLDIKRAPDQLPTRSAYADVGAVRLRRVNLELAMGDGTTLEDWIEEQPYDFDRGELKAITGTSPDRLLIGKGIGDSMEPTIGSHDDVMINRDENELKRFDGIYALTIDGAGAIKRLSPAGDGMIEVISDNPNHANRIRTFPRHAIRIIGRIIWSARRH